MRAGPGREGPTGINIEGEDRFAIRKASDHGDLLLAHTDSNDNETVRIIIDPKGSAELARWNFGGVENLSADSI
jgi:hypothetical protein